MFKFNKKAVFKLNKKWAMPLFLGSIGIIAGTVIIVVLSKTNHKNKMKSFINNKDNFKYNLKGEKIDGNSQEPGISFSLSNSEWLVNNNGVENIIARLANKIMTRGIHGPELLNLKTIFINNPIYTSALESGVFLPSLQKIALSSETFTENLKSKAFWNYNNAEEMYKEIMSELLFQTFFHEYGHYLANVYPSSSIKKNMVVFTYSEKRKPIEDKWSEEFVNDFKSIFSYDQGQPLRPNGNAINGLFSLGQKTSAFYLWNFANDYNHDDPDNVLGNSFYFGDSKTPLSNQLFPKSIVKSKELLYYYSQDELFTRKLLQACYSVDKKSFEYLKRYLYQTGLVFDFSTYNTIIRTSRSYRTINTTPKHNTYMADGVFVGNTSKARDLALILDKAMGSFAGADLSYMGFNNDGKLQKDNTYNVNDLQTDQLRLGGYVSNDYKQYKYLVYLGSDNKYHPISEIVFYNLNLKWKNHLFDTHANAKNLQGKNRESIVWVTKDYFRAGKMAGKPLFFSTDAQGSNIKALKSIRDNDFGKASNYVDIQSNIKNLSDLYVAAIVGGKVEISTSKLWGTVN